MRHRLTSAIAMMVFATACSSSGVITDAPETDTSGSSSGIATASSATTEPSTTTSTSMATESQDLAYFIAAVNDGLVGTTYADGPVDDPEVFIAIGQLFCELIAEGLTVDEVLTTYLTALEGPEGAVDEDDAIVSGMVMGASLEVICPELADPA